MHLDAASGLPLNPIARTTYLEALDHGWADPLRLHHEGRTARLLLDNAREVLASSFRCRPDELSFVSSGTAACRLGVLGLHKGRSRLGAEVVHSAVEHSAVLLASRWATEGSGSTVSVPVDHDGVIDLDAWQAAIGAPGVALACLQAANHEVGTVQPVDAAATVCRAHGVPLLVDVSAAVGWTDISATESAQVLAASAHKWGGPAALGVLVVRSGVRWRAPEPVDEREPAAAGYVDVPGALAAAAALQAVESAQVDAETRMFELTARVRTAVQEQVRDVDVAGHPDDRLPHIVNFSCLYVDGETLVTELDRRGFAVSSGSACTASSLEPSHVLAAMGVLTHGNVRVSISPATTADDLDRFVRATAEIVDRLRAERLGR